MESLEPVKVLIFDSSELWRLSIRTILAEDASLQIVGDGADGLEAVQGCAALQPDLVILDLLLTKLNGLEAARQIREISPGTKILFLTEYRSREMMREALLLGAGFVMKADAEKDLLAVIEGIVREKPVVLFRFDDDGPGDGKR